MTNQEILNIAMAQSAIDSNCRPEDFRGEKNKVVISAANPGARRYLKLPFFCDLTSYGTNIVASVSKEFAPAAKRYIEKFAVAHCFETPNLQVLNDELKKHGMCVCFMAEYFLPDVSALSPLFGPFETRLLCPEDFEDLYTSQWSNALCKERKELDRLAVGAFDGKRLVGLAGCSADCDAMWQIGVDVAPAYRRRGIAASVTSQLAAEVLRRGKVPFYCCAWSNLASARNAIRCGFRPAWVQVTAKSLEFVAAQNGLGPEEK